MKTLHIKNLWDSDKTIFSGKFKALNTIKQEKVSELGICH